MICLFARNHMHPSPKYIARTVHFLQYVLCDFNLSEVGLWIHICIVYLCIYKYIVNLHCTYILAVVLVRCSFSNYHIPVLRIIGRSVAELRKTTLSQMHFHI